MCNVYSALRYFKNQRHLFAVSLSALIFCICLFQLLGYQATYAVRDTSTQRDKQHENTLQYKKQDELFQVAHKNSERYIGLLLFCLLANIGINVTANVLFSDSSRRIEE